ncbi:hypothetical protein, partial [Moorena bouillonii]|uniref:hypothetical protein n=1 Tax=Moorena bouillonii TaxID=207920 RepID=UPI001BE02FDD
MQSLMGETPAGRRCIAIFSSGQDAHSTPIHSSIQQRRKSLPTPYLTGGQGGMRVLCSERYSR